MTENKQKDPTLKPVTGRFRNTRLHWLRPHEIGALGAPPAESVEPSATPQLRHESSAQRRITILTRLSFVPSSLDAHERRVRWRHRLPMVVGLLAAVAAALLCLWVVFSAPKTAVSGPEPSAESPITRSRTPASSTARAVTHAIDPEPALSAAPPLAPPIAPSVVRQLDVASRKPAPVANDKKPRGPTPPPKVEDQWF